MDQTKPDGGPDVSFRSGRNADAPAEPLQLDPSAQVVETPQPEKDTSERALTRDERRALQKAEKDAMRAEQEAQRAEKEARKAEQRAEKDALKAEQAEREAAIQNRAAAIAIAPPAGPARARRRHWGLLASFIFFVMIPLYGIWWYLNERAADQYVSHVGFSVRTEEVSSAMELLGGLTQMSRTTSSDPDILYEFIQSQELVQRVDAQLDLRSMYSKPDNDPIFSYDPEGSIEDLTDYWNRMVKIFYDGSAGMIELRVLAFAPDDAQRIAQEIFNQSTAMINDLSAIAREDATRYSREELEGAIERLKQARAAITEFRNEYQIVDPAADIQGQVGLVNTLQTQLATALIELDLLATTTQSNDPRLEQARRKINVIRERISEERKKFGAGEEAEGQAFSTLIGAYEGLVVDREFAEQAYLSALSAYDSAQAEAQRQSRYLAAFVKPTLAERSTYPRRYTILGVSALFILLVWATAVLLTYALKDRR